MRPPYCGGANDRPVSGKPGTPCQLFRHHLALAVQAVRGVILVMGRRTGAGPAHVLRRSDNQASDSADCPHRIQNIGRALGVGGEVGKGTAVHLGVSGQVNDRIRSHFEENPFQAGLVQDRSLAPANLLVWLRRCRNVHVDDRMARGLQVWDKVPADETTTPGDYYLGHALPAMPVRWSFPASTSR